MFYFDFKGKKCIVFLQEATADDDEEEGVEYGDEEYEE